MSIEAMKQALEALEANQPTNYCINNNGEKFPMFINDQLRQDRNEQAITSLRQAIVEAEKQEPVAWQWLTTAHFRKKLPKDAEKGAWNPLYTHPQPKCEWVGLTKEDLQEFAKETPNWEDLCHAVEAKLKEKNGT